MKEEKTQAKPRKKLIYYIVLAIAAALLIAATVLTVYFVTNRVDGPVIENPGNNPDDNPGGNTGNNPGGPENPDDPGNKPGDDEPDGPTGGEDTVRFVSPIVGAAYTVEYNVIYTNKTLGWIYRHKAVDFEAEEGTAVCSMAEGTIESISYSEETGNIIVVNHGGDLKTIYRFVEPTSTLKEGQKVAKGQQIGTVAAAYGIEHHDGAHLHLEITVNGTNVDPTDSLEPVNSDK